MSTLASFISTHNLDGIDLDWEPFETPSDATDYELFVIALRVALPSPKVITMFVQTNQTWKQTFCNAVEPYIDRFGLSTYDLSYGSTTVIHDSPLYSGGGQPAGASAHGAVTAFIAAGLAPAKLNIAMPQYTAQWTGSAGIFTTGTFNP